MIRRAHILAALAATSLVVAAPVTANARGGPGGHHGGPGFGGHGPGGLALLACDVPAAAKTAVSGSATVTRIKARLDARVAAGTITRAQADERLDDYVTMLALRNIVGEAHSAPLAKLLGLSVADFKKARQDGTLRDKVEAKKLTREQLRTAMREGRTAARAKMTELCGDDLTP